MSCDLKKNESQNESEQLSKAIRWLRGIYGGDPSVVDRLAAERVILSYPIFTKLFDTPVLRGREAVRKFASGFKSRWTDTELTVHRSIEQDDRVALVWSFRGRTTDAAAPDPKSTRRERNWGGITIIQFDSNGSIIEELGEESEPGPIARIAQNNVQGAGEST